MCVCVCLGQGHRNGCRLRADSMFSFAKSCWIFKWVWIFVVNFDSPLSRDKEKIDQKKGYEGGRYQCA